MVYGGLPRTYRLTEKPMSDRSELDELIKKAKAVYDAMTPKEKEAYDKAQRDSWVRGEMALGND